MTSDSWRQLKRRHVQHKHIIFFSHCWPYCNLIVLPPSLFAFIPLLFTSHLSSNPPSPHLCTSSHDSEWIKTKRRSIRLHASCCPACHFLQPCRLCPILIFRQLHWNKWSLRSSLSAECEQTTVSFHWWLTRKWFKWLVITAEAICLNTLIMKMPQSVTAG